MRFRFLIVIASLFLIAACDDNSERTVSDYIASGIEHLEAGRAPAAAIQLKNAIQLQPDDPAPRVLLARTYDILEGYEEVEKEASRAIELGERSEQNRLLLARALVRLGRYDEVLSFTDTYGEFSNEPEATEFLVEKASAYKALGVSHTAEKILERVLEASPNASAFRAQAQEALRIGQFDEAVMLADRAIAAAEDDSEAWLIKGQAQFSKGSNEASRDSLATAYEMAPHSPRIQLFLATSEAALGNYAAANELIERLTQRTSGNLQVRYLEAYLALGQGDYESARNLADNVLAQSPRFSAALAIAGNASLQLGNFELAREYLNKHIAESPNSGSGRLALASVFLELNEVETARSHLLLLRDSEIEYSLTQAANLASRLGDGEMTVLFLRRQLAKNPDDTSAHYFLGRIAQSSGNAALAIDHFKIAAEKAPENIDYRIALAYAAMRIGDVEYALETVTTASELETAQHSAGLQTAWGLALQELEDEEAAEEHFRKALDIEPGYATATSALARLMRERGEHAAGIGMLSEALDKDPGNANLRANLAIALLQDGKVKEAEELVVAGLEETPDSQLLKATLARLTAQVPEATAPRSEIELAQNHFAEPAVLTPIASVEGEQLVLTTEEEFTAKFLQLFAQRRYVEALDVAREYAAAFPASATAYNNMAISWAALQRYDRAIEEYQRALELQPGNEAAAINLASIYLAQNEADKAKALLEGFLEVRANHGRALVKLSETEAKLGNEEEAEQLLRKTIGLYPDEPDPRISLARMLTFRDRAPEAIEILSAVAEEERGNEPFLLSLGLAQINAGLAEEAAATFVAQAQVSNSPATAYLSAANAYSTAQMPEEAEEQLRLAIASQPGFVPARVELIKALLRDDKLSEASEQLNEILLLAPGDAAVADIEAAYYLKQQKSQEAERSLQRAFAIAPTSDRAKRLARLQWSQGERERAITTLATWTDRQKDDITAREELSTYYLLNGAFTEARFELDGLLADGNDTASVRNNLAYALWRLGEAELARIHAETAYEKAPERSGVQGTLGAVLLDNGEAEEALRLLEQVAEKGHMTDWAVSLQFARALHENGESDRAKTVVQGVLDGTPSGEAKAAAEALWAELSR